MRGLFVLFHTHRQVDEALDQKLANYRQSRAKALKRSSYDQSLEYFLL